MTKCGQKRMMLLTNLSCLKCSMFSTKVGAELELSEYSDIIYSESESIALHNSHYVLDHQPHLFNLLSMNDSAFRRVYARGIDIGVSENICQANNIFRQGIIGSSEQMA